MLCTKPDCAFPYAHPEHKYSTYSMQQIVNFLCDLHYCTEEQLIEKLAMEEYTLVMEAQRVKAQRDKAAQHTRNGESEK